MGCASSLQLTPCCCCCRLSCCLSTRPDPETALGRRRLLNEKLKKRQFDDVECFREYVELSDGRLLFTTCWAPKPKSKIAVKGLICFAEGYADCIEFMMDDYYIRLSQMGYVVFSWDNLGQGRSDGLWNYVDNWEAFLENAALSIRTVAMEKYCKQFNIKCPDQCILAGQSMGGAYAVELSKKMRDEFAGMILVAPMCRIDDNIRPPDCTVGCLKCCITPCCPTANLTPTEDINAWLTSDSEVKARVEDHPLLYGRNPRLQTGLELFDATIKIGQELDKITIPFLVLHGTGDKVTDPTFSQYFYDHTNNVPSDKKHIVMYPDAWHLLFDEPQSRKLIYNDIDQWVQSLIGKSSESKEEKKEETEKRLTDVVVVCGPSGVGKGTLLKHLKEKYAKRVTSTISHTTREPRVGEIDGREYHFVSKEKFENMLATNEFIEYAQVHGQYYGTSKEALYQISSNNQIAILEIDVNGAQQFRNKNSAPNAKYLFITMSGGIEKLKDRLKGRGTETEEQVEKRMKTAIREMEFFESNPKFFHHVVVNDNFEKSSQELVETFATWYPVLKS